MYHWRCPNCGWECYNPKHKENHQKIGCRNEALEEAAKVCDATGYATPSVREREMRGTMLKRIRALKTEPTP